MREWRLRPVRESDAKSFARYANNPNIAANLRDAFPNPYTLEDAQAFLRICIEQPEEQALLLIIDIDGEAAGSIGLTRGTDVSRKSAELGYWLAEPFWGRGVMSGAVMEFCAGAFKRYDLARIHAEPFARNTGSRRVLEKAGFTLEGVLRDSVYKNGLLQDSCLYARLR